MTVAVTVVTRTLQRPDMLRQTLDGLLAQTFRDFEWVIVNDGGEPEPVTECADAARQAGLSVSMLHNPAPTGRGAAANTGVRAGHGEFVLLHDDDDAIAPAFLERAVMFLREHGRYGGVAAQTRVIDAAGQSGETVLLAGVDHIRLVDLARRNLFATIGFLYRRAIYDRTDGYAEDVPVLEDWVFNLRFLMEADVAVIPEPLSRYNIRSANADPADPHANSVVAGRALHEECEALIRNRFLREDLRAGRTGLGWLLNPPHQSAADQINEAVRRLNRLGRGGGVAGRLVRWLRNADR